MITTKWFTLYLLTLLNAHGMHEYVVTIGAFVAGTLT